MNWMQSKAFHAHVASFVAVFSCLCEVATSAEIVVVTDPLASLRHLIETHQFDWHTPLVVGFATVFAFAFALGKVVGFWGLVRCPVLLDWCWLRWFVSGSWHGQGHHMKDCCWVGLEVVQGLVEWQSAIWTSAQAINFFCNANPACTVRAKNLFDRW